MIGGRPLQTDNPQVSSEGPEARGQLRSKFLLPNWKHVLFKKKKKINSAVQMAAKPGQVWGQQAAQVVRAHCPHVSEITSSPGQLWNPAVSCQLWGKRGKRGIWFAFIYLFILIAIDTHNKSYILAREDLISSPEGWWQVPYSLDVPGAKPSAGTASPSYVSGVS